MKRLGIVVTTITILAAGCATENRTDVTPADLTAPDAPSDAINDDANDAADDGFTVDYLEPDVPDDSIPADQGGRDADRDSLDGAELPFDIGPDAPDATDALSDDAAGDIDDPCAACPNSVCDPETLECLECTMDIHCGLEAWCDGGTCRDHLCSPGANFCNEDVLYKCSANGGGFQIIMDCNDQDPCTVGDGCADGRCVPGTPVECADDDPCTIDYCGADGACGHYPSTGVVCDDGNPCTTGDKCDAGRCVPGAVNGCNDGNACTFDYCAQLVGCIHEPTSGECSDGSGCTVFDHCIEGRCSGAPADCDDHNQCTSDYCYSGSCRHDRINGCSPCAKDADCPSGGECTVGVCDTATGSCRVEISRLDGCCVDISDCPETPPCVRSFCDDSNRCAPGTLDGDGCCTKDTWAEAFKQGIPPTWTIFNDIPEVGWRLGLLPEPVDGMTAPAIYFGNELETSYDAGMAAAGTFRTEPVALPARSALTMSFDVWQDVDTIGGYDRLEIYIVAATQQGETRTLVWDGSDTVPNRTTTHVGLDVSGFSGRVVAFEFRFDTIDEVSNSGRGLYLDNLRVDATCVPLGCLMDLHCKSAGVNGFCRDSRCDFSFSWMQVDEFGEVGSGTGQFMSPTDVVSMPGPDGVGRQLTVSDSRTHYLQVFKEDGTFVRFFGGYGVTDGKFLTPRGLSASEGRLYIADSGNGRIQAMTPAGVFLYRFGSAGIDPAQFDAPRDTAVSPDGDFVYVADTGNHRISVFSRLGAYRFSFGAYGRTDGRFRTPSALTVTPNGDVWVCDTQNNRLQVFSSRGVLKKVIAPTGESALWYPGGIAALPGGGVVVADTYNHRLVMFDADGSVNDILGRYGTGRGEFVYPSDVDVFDSGSGLRMVVADAGNFRIVTWAVRMW